MNSVGANIKARRRELGMNQDELARRLGLTQANISRIEANAKGPSADMLPAIAEALCCDVRDLLRRTCASPTGAGFLGSPHSQ